MRQPPSPRITRVRRAHTRRARLLHSVLLSCVLGGLAVSREPSDARSKDGSGPFTRGALVSRFDADRDGKLDEEEREALREAFGGIDVPLLPTKPYKYTLAHASNYAGDSQLRQADNTPVDNPMNDHGVALGRVLFYDRMLSRNDTIACASCHHQDRGFSDPRQFSIGFEGGHTKRNSMGLANLRYTNFPGRRPGFFWDERAPTLEVQVLMPIQDKVEMGMELPQLEEKLRNVPYYPPLFNAAFGSTEITSERIARAVAQFMRAMVSFDSKFDRCAKGVEAGHYAEDFDGFTAEENRGKSLFIRGIREVAEFGCAFCHIPPTFRMPKSFNNGLDAVYEDRGLGALDRPSNDPFTPTNDGKFKAPSLRNIEHTAPDMPDGRFETLEQVIKHYSSGVHPHENLGLAFEEQESVTKTSGFRYSSEQKAALVAFLKTLTDEKFMADPRFSDPFVRKAPRENAKLDR